MGKKMMNKKPLNPTQQREKRIADLQVALQKTERERDEYKQFILSGGGERELSPAAAIELASFCESENLVSSANSVEHDFSDAACYNE